MNKFFSKIFNKEVGSKKENLLYFEDGLAAYEKACILADNKSNDEALEYFDIAVNCGIEEAYQERGYCLHSSGYYFDAIEDLSKAIEFMPTDCNLYFSRGLAKDAIGNFTEAILDGELAITYSKFDTELNKEREKESKNLNLIDFRNLYRIQLEGWKLHLKRFEDQLIFIEQLRLKGDIKYANEELERSQKLIRKNSKRRI